MMERMKSISIRSQILNFDEVMKETERKQITQSEDWSDEVCEDSESASSSYMFNFICYDHHEDMLVASKQLRGLDAITGFFNRED